MPLALITVGLPGSGKSKWASLYCQRNPYTRRLERDWIRASVGCLPFGNLEQESEVTEIWNRHLDHFIRRGEDIVISDTNLNTDRLKTLCCKLVGRGYTVALVDFTHVPVDICLERDRNRKHTVGEEVINKFGDQVSTDKLLYGSYRNTNLFGAL